MTTSKDSIARNSTHYKNRNNAVNKTPEGADRPPDVWRLDPTALRLELLALGYRPIPLAAGAKTPPKAFPLADYLSGAPITPDVIETWARRWPEATNTGLLCGGDLLVIDADNAAIVRYLDTIGLPMTPVVETSRGRHYYFKRPAWLTSSQTGEGAPLPGLDAKATGYVVAPGSLHPSGAEYRALVPLDTPLAELPEWLADMLRRNTAPTPNAITPPLTASATDTSNLLAAIEAALGVTSFNAAGFSNSVSCPFHDDHHASATWTRDGGGQLYCHAGCRPQSRHTSRGRVTFGAIDTARALGIPLQAKNTTAPASAGLGRTPNGGGATGSNGNDTEPQTAHEAEAVFFRAFFTPLLSIFTKVEKSAKNKNTRGRRAATFYMRDLDALTSAAQGLTYRPLKAAEIANARQYRALAYAPVTAGTQRRATMARRVGVTARTAIEYDKLARVGVTPRVIRREITERAALELPAKRKDAPPNVWLESTAGRKFKPTRAGLRDAIAESVQYSGRAVATHCTQGANFYTPPDRDGTPQGVPVQFRRMLIKEGHGAYARLLDALLLAGVQHGDELTTPEVIALVARYGLGASTVRRALADVAARVAHPDLTAAPQAVPSATLPPEVVPETHQGAPDRATEAAQLVLGGEGRAGPVCRDCGRPATEHKLTGWYCAEHAPNSDKVVTHKKRGAA